MVNSDIGYLLFYVYSNVQVPIQVFFSPVSLLGWLSFYHWFIEVLYMLWVLVHCWIHASTTLWLSCLLSLLYLVINRDLKNFILVQFMVVLFVSCLIKRSLFQDQAFLFSHLWSSFGLHSIKYFFLAGKFCLHHPLRCRTLCCFQGSAEFGEDF